MMKRFKLFEFIRLRPKVRVVMLMVTMVHQLHCFEIISESEKRTLYSTPCIKKFCEHYFRSEHAMKGSLVIMNLTPVPSIFQSKIIEILDEDVNHEFSVMIKDSRKKHLNASHVSEKAQNYFMFIASYEDVNSTVNQWKSLPTWNPLAQVLVLFTETFEDLVLEMQTIAVLEKLLEYSMLNVNVMSHKLNTNVVQVVTWFPYEKQNCANKILDLRSIDECEFLTEPPDNETVEAYYYNEVVYFGGKKKPTKIPLLKHGCPLKISSSVYEPYTFFDVEQAKFTKGIEVFMLDTIAHVLRMKPVYYLLNDTRESRLSDVLTEGYVQLINGTTDVMIGGMDEDANTRKYLTSSIPYYQDDQTWCVAVAKPEELWKNIFNLFSLLVWAGIIGIVYLIAAILYIITKIDNKMENFHWSFLASLSLTMGLATIYEPQKTNIRFMFFFFLFYGLIFSSAFHSFLVGVLTNPRQKPQVDMPGKALKNNFEFTGGTVSLAHFDAKDEETKQINAAFRICAQIDPCLAKLRQNDKLAVSLSREHSINSPVITKPEIFCFSKANNVYSYSVAMLAKRNYHLLPEMNSIIRRVVEFGLIEKWEKESGAKTDNVVVHSGGGEGENLVVLTVGHITGALIIMSIGYFFGLLCFLAEIIVWHYLQRNTNNWFWQFCDKFFDPKRYF